MNVVAPIIASSQIYKSLETGNYIVTQMSVENVATSTIISSEMNSGNIRVCNNILTGLNDPGCSNEVCTFDYISKCRNEWVSSIPNNCVIINNNDKLTFCENFYVNGDECVVPTINTKYVGSDVELNYDNRRIKITKEYLNDVLIPSLSLGSSGPSGPSPTLSPSLSPELSPSVIFNLNSDVSLSKCLFKNNTLMCNEIKSKFITTNNFNSNNDLLKNAINFVKNVDPNLVKDLVQNGGNKGFVVKNNKISVGQIENLVPNTTTSIPYYNNGQINYSNELLNNNNELIIKGLLKCVDITLLNSTINDLTTKHLNTRTMYCDKINSDSITCESLVIKKIIGTSGSGIVFNLRSNEIVDFGETDKKFVKIQKCNSQKIPILKIIKNHIKLYNPFDVSIEGTLFFVLF